MTNAITLYHGAYDEFELHLGQCYTDDASAAQSYADRGEEGVLVSVALDLTDLTVVTVEGYNRDEDEAPGDRSLSEFPGVDVIMYADEDMRGWAHDCWRLVSERALSAVTVGTSIQGSNT